MYPIEKADVSHMTRLLHHLLFTAWDLSWKFSLDTLFHVIWYFIQNAQTNSVFELIAFAVKGLMIYQQQLHHILQQVASQAELEH